MRVLVAGRRRTIAIPSWWPLAALLVLAAVIRCSTLGLQSFWFDEAFTPTFVLRPGLSATLQEVMWRENTPPLWYVLAWGWSRWLGTGVLALRSLSAIAGVATVPVAWAIGRELGSRRTAIVLAALVAVNPLLVWYSQEARSYPLFILVAALTFLFFLRAERDPTNRRLAAWALAGAASLLTHYFAVFLLVPQVLWLLVQSRGRRWVVVLAVEFVGGVGLLLLPMAAAQGGHGTDWIRRWPLADRLDSIPRDYLLGPVSVSLGHSVELLVLLPLLAGAVLGLRRGLDRDERRGVGLAAGVGLMGLLPPVLLAALGVDYLAPRNVIGVWLPVTAALAVVLAARGGARPAGWLAALSCVGFLAIVTVINLDPYLQRADWRDMAKVLRNAPRDHAVVVPQVGSPAFQYYLPGLHFLFPGRFVRLRQIDLVGYSPLVRHPARPPARGFVLVARRTIRGGLVVYRFRSRGLVTISERALRDRAINREWPEVLFPRGMPTLSSPPPAAGISAATRSGPPPLRRSPRGS